MGSLRERRLKRRVKFDQNEEETAKNDVEGENETNEDHTSVTIDSGVVGHSAMSTAALNAQYRARRRQQQQEQQQKDLVVR